jgi:hypothetical protein
MVFGKQQAGNKYRINTTPEYSNELVRYLAEKLGEESTRVTGIIVSTRDLTEELEFQNKKQFMGVKQYILDRDITGTELLELCDKFPASFLGLSFNVGDTELKIKAKAPKSSKPSSKGGEKPKVDFCKIKTKDKELVNKLFFDIPEFKQAEISYDFLIREIVITDELKEAAEGDYAKIKEMAKRKGRIIRNLIVDGEERVVEKEFEV